MDKENKARGVKRIVELVSGKIRINWQIFWLKFLSWYRVVFSMSGFIAAKSLVKARCIEKLEQE